MLAQFDYLEKIIRERNNKERFIDSRLKHFASEVLEILETDAKEELSTALERTFRSLEALGISTEQNVRKIYRFNGEELLTDYRVSDLALYLIIINCNPSYSSVAKAQVHFAFSKIKDGPI